MKKSESLFYFQIVALIGLIVFPFYAQWYDWLLGLIMYLMMNTFGQGMIYHRLVTHRSFVCPRWYYMLANFTTTLAGVGSAMAWAANHLQHHRNSDTEKDVHSPHVQGAWWIYTRSMANPVNTRYMVAYTRDKILVWFHNYYWYIHLAYILLLLIVYPFGIISLYLAPAHLTWMVSCLFNICCHLYGYRNFDTRDCSTNNTIIGWLSFGEGWHNNHHESPGNYTNKVKPNEIDGIGWMIDRIRLDKKYD